ncbi:fibronectin type III domain-containing protein [Dyadobacter sp. CY323]|uniref:fibronectin type III domain-containing protein n=1 Tax=Dyadobacter sp. CY323 TaxID=2907302 RepID=UPI001F1E06E4|nr:fibronectin type III domain-containing protein [Dyadobacter sp. CY323]MCE6987733.1 T9SS type A sorting domain-containing protein [Dyadobacter sp. CY323]
MNQRFIPFIVQVALFCMLHAMPSHSSGKAFAIPKPPLELTAAAISQVQITLTWQDASPDETGFELERSLDGKTFTKLIDLPINTVTYQNIGLTASTAYFYRIRAVNASGSSAYSNIASDTTKAPVITIPKPPATLVATAISGYQINLSWTDSATDETGFELERSIDGTNFIKIADLAVNAVAFQNTGLVPVTRYWYRILAKNTAGKSAYSNIADDTTFQVLPAAPTELTATAMSPAQINLSWVDQAINETGYQVERSLDGVAFVKIADLGVNATTFQNTALNAATLYYYRVRAVNAVGGSTYSSVASVKTQNIPVPDQPDDFTAVPTGPELVQLRWSPVTGNATEIVVERALGSHANFVQIAKLGANVQQYEDRGKLATADYFYRIKATNAGGSSPYSLISIVRASSIITSTKPDQHLVFVSEKVLITELKNKSGGKLRIYDTMGRSRAESIITSLSRTDLSNLTSGIYIILITTDLEVISRKVLLF